MLVRTRSARGGFWSSRRGGRSLADSLAAVLLAVAAVAGIFAVSPLATDIHQFPKFALFVPLVALAAFLWLVGRLRAGSFSFYEFSGWKFLGLAAVVAVISALAADDRGLAIFGAADQVGISLLTLLALGFFVFLTRQYLHSPRWLRGCRDALVIAGVVILVTFLARIFLPLPFIFGRLGLSPLTAVPSEIGVLAAALVGLALGVLALGELSRARIVLWSLLGVLALVVVVLVGVPRLWLGVALAAVLVLAALLARDRKLTRVWPAIALALLIVSVPLAFFGTPRAARLALPVELNLSVGDSWTVTKSALAQGFKPFLLGTGFGGYGSSFALYRPMVLNILPAFSATVIAPAGLNFLLLIEGGVLFAVPLVLFALAILLSAVGVWRREESLRSRLREALAPSSRSSTLSFGDVWSLLAAFLALRAATFVTTPSLSLIIVATIILALYFSGQAIFVNTDEPRMQEWPWRGQPKARWLVLSTMTVFFVGWLFFFGRFVAAEVIFGSAIRDFNAGNFVAAAAAARSAAQWNDADRRYQLGVTQTLVEQARRSKQPADVAAAENALRSSASVESRDVNYWLSLAGSARRISDQSAEAKKLSADAVQRAVLRSPANPTIRLVAGDIFADAGKSDSAAEQFATAIAIKPNYLEAYLHWASMVLASKNTNLAYDLALQAVRIAPGDRSALTFFVNVALARRATGDEAAAASALGAILAGKPDDTDALRLLAGVLERLDLPADALAAYRRLLQLQPGDAQIKQKIAELEAAASRPAESATAASSTAPAAPKSP